jgi:catechol 2,3-dioxygenase-like lactoylglutathione lyase family enzyme
VIDAIDHVVLYSGDSERTIAFYRGVLGCTIELEDEWRGGRMPVFRLRFDSHHYVNVHPSGSVLTPRAAAPAPGGLDICFRSSLPSASVVERFAAHGVPVEEGPVPRRDAFGNPSVSVYVRDPDGNLVEVMSAT